LGASFIEIIFIFSRNAVSPMPPMQLLPSMLPAPLMPLMPPLARASRCRSCSTRDVLKKTANSFQLILFEEIFKYQKHNLNNRNKMNKLTLTNFLMN
jgi:hypothetical protein